MLHPSKSQSILQWFNSMVTKGAIQSLAQLSDGLQFYDVVTTINGLKKGNLSDPSLSSVDNLLDSNTSLVSTAPTETESTKDENNAEENSSAAEMAVDDSAPENHEGTETKVAEGDVVTKAKNDAEIEKRFEMIKEFIDDFSNLDSSSLITYLDCIRGKELELAKVAVLLLSAMVQSFISTNNDQLYTTTLLDIQVQEDIKECLSLVLEAGTEDGPLKKSELHRILSRPSKSKGTPRRRTPSRGTAEVTETPESSKMPKKRRDRASIVAEEIFESPLKSLLESPKIQFKAAMFKKDAEIYKLREALDAEETKVIDLNLEKRSLNAELEKKKRELEFLKEEHRKLQECVNEVDDLKKTKMEEILAEKESDKKEICNLKEELEILKQENENFLNEISDLKEKLSGRSNAEEVDYKKKYEESVEIVKDLELNVNIKIDKIKNLKEEVAAKEMDLKAYKHMYEELSKSRKSVSQTSPKVFENVSNIIYADERSARDKLAEKENECAEVRKQLTAEMEKSKKLERLAKAADNDRMAAVQNTRSLQIKLSNMQSDLESSQKQISIYESWAKSMGNNGSILNLNDELAPGNLPGSLPSGLWPSSASDVSERERNVKEEPESAKLWDTFSGKSMETRSRSASALGYHRDSFANSTVSCSESEFVLLKKVARAIAKLLKKKCDSAEIQHLAHLEEQARCLGSVKDLCDFYQSVLESLKSLRVAAFPIPEIPSKRKCRSQTAEDTDSNVIYLLSQNKTLETELESMKQDLSKLQKESKNQLEAQVQEVKAAEDKIKKLETDIKELNDKLEKSQQEAKDANKKYELAKKRIEMLNVENKRLVRACMILKDDAGPKVEPCKACELLREKLSDIKQERNVFKKDAFELKAIVQDLESKNKYLDRQLKNEIKEKKKLEFQIQRENAFLTGSLSERNAVVHQYFQQGLAEESKKAKIRAENERKSLVEVIEKPRQVSSINKYILTHENREPYPENSLSNASTYINRSIRSGFLQTDDEEDFLNHSSLAQIQREVFPEPDADNRRLTEIQRRNTLCLPHLQSSYPLELQNMTPTERKYFKKVKPPALSNRKLLESAAEETYAESVNDSEDSQDVQLDLPLRKRKEPEIRKFVQPVKKAKLSSQAQLGKRKPLTPGRKTGFISKTKSFRTPTSLRRLMRMSQKK